METGIPGGIGHQPSQNDPRARSDGAQERGFDEYGDFPNPENGDPLENGGLYDPNGRDQLIEAGQSGRPKGAESDLSAQNGRGPGATDGFRQGGEAGEEGPEGTSGRINRELMYNKLEQDAEEANHEEYGENARDAFYGNGGGSEGKISPDELKGLPVDQLMQFPPKAQPNLSGNSSRNKSKSQSQNGSARVNENGSQGQTGSFQG